MLKVKDIKVSICCQTYNHVNYIEKCIEGFLMQKTNFIFEILLRDDASTDGTTDIVKEYSNKYPEIIRSLIYDENQLIKGIKPFADNVKRATGKYIALCEGDDYWIDPYKLQKQVDLLENSKSDFCYSDFNIYDEENEVFINEIYKNNFGFVNKNNPLLCFGPLGVPSWVFKTEFLKSIDLNNSRYIDTSLFILFEFLRENGKICFLEDCTTVYRKNSNSVSNNIDRKKRYSMHKSTYLFMYDYFQHYNIYDIESRNKIISLSINILSETHEHNDNELLKIIKDFLWQNKIDITQILHKFQERDKYKQNYESLENSKLRKLVNRLKKR